MVPFIGFVNNNINNVLLHKYNVAETIHGISIDDLFCQDDIVYWGYDVYDINNLTNIRISHLKNPLGLRYGDKSIKDSPRLVRIITDVAIIEKIIQLRSASTDIIDWYYKYHSFLHSSPISIF